MSNDKIMNMKDVRDTLVDALEHLRDNPKYVPQAHETANLSGKIIRTCALQIELAKLNNEQVGKDWLEFIKG